MALLSKGNIFAIVEEVTFNTAPAFVDTDTQDVTSDTNLAPNVDSIERDRVGNLIAVKNGSAPLPRPG